MEFHEPTVEYIRIDTSNVISTSCTTDANQNPSFQSCSTGSPHEGFCSSESDDWEEECTLAVEDWVDCLDSSSRDHDQWS